MENQWVQDPFSNPVMSDLPPVVQDKLLELWCDAGLQSRFGWLSLSEFWLSYYDENPKLTEMAVKTILPFHSTYLCETIHENKGQKQAALRKNVPSGCVSVPSSSRPVSGEKAGRLCRAMQPQSLT